MKRVLFTFFFSKVKARYLAARFAKPSQPSQHSLDDEPISVIDVDDEDTNIWDGPKLVLQRVKARIVAVFNLLELGWSIAFESWNFESIS